MATRKASAKKAAPKKRPTAKKPRAAKKEPTAREKLDALGLDAMCASIADGKSMTDISKQIGVSFGSLATWLEADPERSARAREARSQVARLWDEKAEDEIRSATDNFELARAKELSHHFRWRASKIAPREYGDKVAVGQDPDLQPLTVVVKSYADATGSA